MQVLPRPKNQSYSSEGEMSSTDPLHPSPALLCKLGSIAAHAVELLSPDGHHFDKAALDQLMADQEVREWLRAMDAMAMVPKPRKS